MNTFLLSALADFVNKRISSGLEVSDELARLAGIHQVEGIIYYQTKSEKLRPAYYASIAGSTTRMKLFDDVCAALDAAGISYYPVKGAAIAPHYPVPQLRTMGDCDITVKSDDRAAVLDILAGLGFENKVSNDDHEWVFFKNGIEFEIHDGLLYYDAINTDTEMKLMDRHWDYVSGHRPDPDFHFVYLLVHLKKHFLYYGVGFRQFMDIAVEYLYGGINMNRAGEFIKEAGLEKFAGVCFALCNRWFDVCIPGAAEISDEFFASATEKIMKDGVFGFNNKENSENNNLNRVRRNGRARSVLRSLFPEYKDCRYVKEYSWVNGRPYLLPAVWVYRFFRSVKDRKMLDRGAGQIKKVVTADLSDRDKMLKEWGI